MNNRYVVFVSSVAGVAIAGKLTDAFGRRAAFWLSALVFLVAGIWCYISPSVGQLVMARMLPAGET
jgi:MFS family permease